jgi:hypothetical protein
VHVLLRYFDWRIGDFLRIARAKIAGTRNITEAKYSMTSAAVD